MIKKPRKGLFLASDMVKIVQVDKNHILDLAPLFDAYRVFYKQKSDIKTAKKFLSQRIGNNESVIFLAYFDNRPVGFTQLYTTFSSVTMQAVFILNDLYVGTNYRKKGIGEALLERAKDFCKKKSYKGLALETATDNPARHLYERLGWEKDTYCFHYFWTS